MTDLTFFFDFPNSILGAFSTNGRLTFVGVGTTPGTASPGPFAVMQQPVWFQGQTVSTFKLHYSFGGETVPLGQPLGLSFSLGFEFEFQ